jgi:hypothetical protein
VQWKSIDISEQHIASTFKVEEEAKQETSMKLVASKSVVMFQKICVELFITTSVRTSDHRNFCLGKENFSINSQTHATHGPKRHLWSKICMNILKLQDHYFYHWL